jgi:hypothetical protein
VNGIPFLVLYRHGRPVAEVVGARPKQTIERALGLDEPTMQAAQHGRRATASRILFAELGSNGR